MGMISETAGATRIAGDGRYPSLSQLALSPWSFLRSQPPSSQAAEGSQPHPARNPGRVGYQQERVVGSPRPDDATRPSHAPVQGRHLTPPFPFRQHPGQCPVWQRKVGKLREIVGEAGLAHRLQRSAQLLVIHACPHMLTLDGADRLLGRNSNVYLHIVNSGAPDSIRSRTFSLALWSTLRPTRRVTTHLASRWCRGGP